MLSETDEEHLRLLSIFHYVLAGLSLLFGLLPLFYIFIGTLVIGASAINSQSAEAGFIGGALIAVGVAIAVVIFVTAGIQFLAGRFLSQHRNYSFCFIFAIVQLFFFPMGTALGIFTIIVLSRPQVKAAMTSQGLLA